MTVSYDIILAGKTATDEELEAMLEVKDIDLFKVSEYDYFVMANVCLNMMYVCFIVYVNM